MNRDQSEGKYKEIKGKAKRIWGELTDDDFRKADGNTDKLFGIIQKRFGDSKEKIRQKLDNFGDDDRPSA